MKTQSITITNYTTIDGKSFLNDYDGACAHELALRDRLDNNLDLREFVKVNEHWAYCDHNGARILEPFTVLEIFKEKVKVQNNTTKEIIVKDFSNWNPKYRHQLLDVIEGYRYCRI